MKKHFAVINGVGNKLGRAFALRLAAHEINLILISPPEIDLTTLVDTCRKYKIEVVCQNSDLNEHEHLDEVTEWINAKYDVALIVNNFTCLSSRSGIKHKMESGLTEMTGELLTQALLPNLRRQRRAYVLHVVTGRSQRIRHLAAINQHDVRNTNVSFMIAPRNLLSGAFHFSLRIIRLLGRKRIIGLTDSFAEVNLQRLFKRRKNCKSWTNDVSPIQTLANVQD